VSHRNISIVDETGPFNKYKKNMKICDGLETFTIYNVSKAMWASNLGPDY
jgi:hypothetical protein